MLEDGGDGRACILVDVGDEACKETSQRVCLRPLTTKETSLLPTVGLRPVVASRPTWFALVRQDDFNELSTSTDAPSTRSTLSRLKHAQSAQGKGAFELIPDSGNGRPLLPSNIHTG